MMRKCRPFELSNRECMLIVGLLEDIQWDEEYYTAWPAEDRCLIESIIRKLGGTVAREVHSNV